MEYLPQMAPISCMINLEVILSFRNFCLSIKEFISLSRRCLDSLLMKFFSCDKQQTVTRKGNKGGQFSEYLPIRNSIPCSCGIPLHACTWGNCLLERKKKLSLKGKTPNRSPMKAFDLNQEGRTSDLRVLHNQGD